MEILFAALAGFIGGMLGGIFVSVGSESQPVDKLAREGVQKLAETLGGNVAFYSGLNSVSVYGLSHFNNEVLMNFYQDFWRLVKGLGFVKTEKKCEVEFIKNPGRKRT